MLSGPFCGVLARHFQDDVLDEGTNEVTKVIRAMVKPSDAHHETAIQTMPATGRLATVST